MTTDWDDGHWDDIVVGAGHNGLTAAAYLARAGRRVLVLEAADHIGGATVSAQAFPGMDVRLSRYSYLVSLMPRQIIDDLDLDVDLIRRRYSSYTPLPADAARGILVDSDDEAATAAGFSAADFAAWNRFYDTMTRIASRVFPTLTEPLLAADDLARRAGDNGADPEAAELWQALTTRPLGDILLERFDDDVVRGIVATDGLIGTFADLTDPDLRQNICLLYHLIGGGTGDWDVPVGGMGAVSGGLAQAAQRFGADIHTSARVTAIDPDTRTVTWRTTGGESTASAENILAACAPAVLDRLLGVEPAPLTAAAGGAQLKINLLLDRLPRLADQSVDPAAAFAGTFHINETYPQLQAAYAQAADGHIPDVAPCEIYCHTLSDDTILGPNTAGKQTLTLFGLHMPPHLFLDADGQLDEAGSLNKTAKERAVQATLDSLDSVLGEPIRDVIARDSAGNLCLEAKTPVELQTDVGLPGGNIFHRPLQWPWAESDAEIGTWGVETDHPHLFIAGAGARRGGGVSGIPGRNAAAAILGTGTL